MPPISDSVPVRRIIFEGKNYLLIPTDVEGEVELVEKRASQADATRNVDFSLVQSLQSKMEEKDSQLQELRSKLDELSTTYQEQLTKHASVVQSLMKTLNSAHKDNDTLTNALNMVVHRRHPSLEDPSTGNAENAENINTGLSDEELFFKREKHDNLRAMKNRVPSRQSGSTKQSSPRPSMRPQRGFQPLVEMNENIEVSRKVRSRSAPLQKRKQSEKKKTVDDYVSRLTAQGEFTPRRPLKFSHEGDSQHTKKPTVKRAANVTPRSVALSAENAGEGPTMNQQDTVTPKEEKPSVARRIGAAFQPHRRVGNAVVRTVDLTEA